MNLAAATYIFVYGTLLSSFTNPYQQVLSNAGIKLGRGKVKGTLYDLGEYPGLVLSEDVASEIEGEVYKLEINPLEILMKLDEYEGDEYTRKLAEIAIDGNVVTAFLYEYIGSPANLVVIKENNYVLYCGRKNSIY